MFYRGLLDNICDSKGRIGRDHTRFDAYRLNHRRNRYSRVVLAVAPQELLDIDIAQDIAIHPAQRARPWFAQSDRSRRAQWHSLPHVVDRHAKSASIAQ